jgi:hypothetical protein
MKMKELEHATKNMWELECAIKRTKEIEHATKRMRASTREGMIIQFCMGVRCKQWTLQLSQWFVIIGLTFN